MKALYLQGPVLDKAHTVFRNYHLNPATAWNKRSDGRVFLKPEKWT
jgi:hypothetical protein